MEILYIVMPAYNEEGNIENVIRSWYPMLKGKSKDSRLVVADSGSTDGTHAILLKLKTEYPQLEILENTGKQHGPKLMALYDHAIKSKADYVFQTDSDGQTNPEEFQEFWGKRTEYDGIFGNRTVREDGKVRDFIEKTVCLLLRLYFGVKIPDANAPFRLMRTNVLKKYLYKLPSDYNIPNIMIATYYTYYRERTAFCRISFKQRQHGKNSVNIIKIVGIGQRALKDFSRFRRELSGNAAKYVTNEEKL